MLSFVENLFLQKKPLQDLLSSLNAVFSTNESTQIYNRSCDLQPGLYLQIPTENHPSSPDLTLVITMYLIQYGFLFLLHIYYM